MFSKSKHGLTIRCIDQKDKQNFESTLVSENVEQCVKEIDNEMHTKGTILYLQIMRDVQDAFLNKVISPLSCNFLMWRTIFFCRIWHKWLEENDYCEVELFITPNAYMCIEINGRLLVDIVANIINGILHVGSLRVWKTRSQSCKQRSMTPTCGPVINFTLKGMLDRSHKITGSFR